MHSVAMQDPNRRSALLRDEAPDEAPFERADTVTLDDSLQIERLAAMAITVSNGCVVAAFGHLADLSGLDQREARMHRRVLHALYDEWASSRERQQIDHGVGVP